MSVVTISEDVELIGTGIILEKGDRFVLLEDVPLPKSVYHNSRVKIKQLDTRVMWFALNFSEGNAWFKNAVDDGDDAYLYEMIVKPGLKIADKNSVGYSLDSLSTDLVSNPTDREVKGYKEVKDLIKDGYAGLVFSDYDPRDFQKDADSLILFNPKDSIVSFKLIANT